MFCSPLADTQARVMHAIRWREHVAERKRVDRDA